jgi:tRNA A37 threonylcarbamoyladenosine dehydratase
MQHYGTIVVVGGGCYGSYYVQQLARARQAGALGFSRLLVVDRDPDCRVSHVLRTPDGAATWRP